MGGEEMEGECEEVRGCQGCETGDGGSGMLGRASFRRRALGPFLSSATATVRRTGAFKHTDAGILGDPGSGRRRQMRGMDLQVPPPCSALCIHLMPAIYSTKGNGAAQQRPETTSLAHLTG